MEKNCMKTGLSEMSYFFLKETVGRAMENYEIRRSQIEMLKACSKTISDGGILMAEAGTGTGKTFAYLIPSILSKKRAIISTRTINLQEQLVSKDLKFLSSLYSFDYAIAKGRSNYLCLRRLNAFRHESDEESVEYRNILIWVSKTEDGDIEDYGLKKPSIWVKVSSDPDACKGRKCGHFNQCFYFRARQKWDKAQILVANHALICLNAMIANDAKILPQADVLVIDEVHALDHVLSEYAGINLSKRGFENILNTILKVDERGVYKGILSKSPHLFQSVESIRAEMQLLWAAIKNHLKNRETIKQMGELKEFMNGISGKLDSLIYRIRTETTGLFKENDEIEIKAAIIKLRKFANELEAFSEGMDGFVRWAEIEENRIALRMAPIYPRDFVMNAIIPEYRSIILTSATLSAAGDFGFIENILGFEGADKITVPSPFDLRKQVKVEVKRGVNLQGEDGIERLAKVITEEASRKDGGILVLFTSKEVMNKTWGLTHERLLEIGFNPMIQGQLPSRTMVETMRESENSVIFGLDSFWEGVDVKGDSLKCLIITKLPFEVPSEPIAKARTEEIEKNGGSPFYEYSLPKAILKFRQGFGRLIRSKNDSGRVIICDERVETKPYGKRFTNSLF
jgi:ATP-dependent DNA helicase DinG